MAIAVSLPALAARPHITAVQGRSIPGVVSLRDGILGCKLRTAPVWRQDLGGVQFRRSRSAGVVSSSMAPAKEEVPEVAQRASASPFNVLITGSTKGKASYASIVRSWNGSFLSQEGLKALCDYASLFA